MNLEALATYVSSKVGRTDPYAVGLARGFTTVRHRLIYEAFDWKSAQKVVDIEITEATAGEDLDVSGLDKIISVRYNGRFLDPVLTQFIFDTRPELLDAIGEPEFYTENYNQETGTRTLRLFPRPGPDQISPPPPGPHPRPVPPPRPPPPPRDAVEPIPGPKLIILGKTPFNEVASHEMIAQVPYVESALIAYVEADMLAWLRQYAKSESKIKEAKEELEKAKANDTPPAARPRQSKVLTVSGNSLEELADSVCDILGRWEPETRISVKEKIRRNYQTLWELALWPESTVVARVTATDKEQVVLPHYFDRVIAVRPDDGSIAQLRNAEVSLFFNIDPQIFERDDNPVWFSMISPSATAVLPPFTEPITCILMGANSCGPLRPHQTFVDETTKVFFKGEGNGVESAEELTVHTMPPVAGPCLMDDVIATGSTTENSYDVALTLSKSPTVGRMDVYGTQSRRLLLTLSPQERERKHIRIWLLPNRRSNVSAHDASLRPVPPPSPPPPEPVPVVPSTYLVLGKRTMSPLVSDNDTCQLRNVENILINGAAADMLMASDANLANVYRTKAGELLKALVDGETKQNAYEPTVTPYVEPTYSLR